MAITQMILTVMVEKLRESQPGDPAKAERYYQSYEIDLARDPDIKAFLEKIQDDVNPQTGIWLTIRNESGETLGFADGSFPAPGREAGVKHTREVEQGNWVNELRRNAIIFAERRFLREQGLEPEPGDSPFGNRADGAQSIG